MNPRDEHAGQPDRILELRPPAEVGGIVRLGDPLALRFGRGLILSGASGPEPAEPQIRRPRPAADAVGRRAAAA